MEIAKQYEILFKDCGDLVSKSFFVGEKEKLEVYIMYVDGLADHRMVEDFVLGPLVEAKRFHSKTEIENFIMEVADYKWLKEQDEVVREVLSGNTVFLVESLPDALMISTKNFPNRSVSTPDSEATTVGPKDAFVENMRMNTALIRRRIRDPKLKVKQDNFGVRSQTSISFMYMEDLIPDGLLEECQERFEQYKIDAVYDSGMVEQLLNGDWTSVFPQYQHTERPDKVASGIMEGRLAIVVDTCPEVILLPATLNAFFQASDDYYCHASVATFARILRYIAAFLAISLPGLYMAVAGYHGEVLPLSFLQTLVEARKDVAVPVVVEILMMEVAFELLREAGIRLPGQMGNTIGVVGGLIVGQAAVDAGLVSTIVVIVVALTAISSFSIPNEAFTSAFRLLKFAILIASACFGIYGWLLGIYIVIMHLASLESFGVAYLKPAVDANAPEDGKDFIVKRGIHSLVRRPSFSGKKNQIRLRKGEKNGR